VFYGRPDWGMRKCASAHVRALTSDPARVPVEMSILRVAGGVRIPLASMMRSRRLDGAPGAVVRSWTYGDGGEGGGHACMLCCCAALGAAGESGFVVLGAGEEGAGLGGGSGESRSGLGRGSGCSLILGENQERWDEMGQSGLDVLICSHGSVAAAVSPVYLVSPAQTVSSCLV
jgi:hypothetical protein